MPIVLSLPFQLVVYGLNYGSFPQQDFIPYRHQAVLHVALDSCNQIHIIVEEHFEEVL